MACSHAMMMIADTIAFTSAEILMGNARKFYSFISVSVVRMFATLRGIPPDKKQSDMSSAHLQSPGDQ